MKPFLLIAFTVWFLGPIAIRATEPRTSTSTFQKLKDSKLDAFTITVEVTRPVHPLMPGQGDATRMVRIAVSDGVIAMVWKTTQLPNPLYFPPTTPGYQSIDYDESGNLIVSMWNEGAAVSDDKINDEYSEDIGFLVSPSGEVRKRSSGPLLVRNATSDSNTQTIGHIRQILWALGRPMTDSLDIDLSEEAHANGMSSIRSRGWWATNFNGATCNLVVDRENGHLVRRATFGDERELPRAESSNKGIRRFGGVILAEEGEFVFPPDERITVKLVSFVPRFDGALLEESKNIIGRARTRLTQVMDKREASGNPKIRLVPAGDLENE